MGFVVVIPARYDSVRLPGKPLLDLAGMPMVQRVWSQACRSRAERVVVATDNDEIRRVVEGFGGEVCMTSSRHPSGTDRLQEACRLLGLAGEQIVVNVQGDEPLIPPAVIDQVATSLERSEARMATLSEPVDHIRDFLDPNIVKVVTDRTGRALYFSRAPVPWPREEPDQLPPGSFGQRHLGIYAYRVELLDRFVEWGLSGLESVEKLEQLRVLWHGVDIHVEEACESLHPGVDTQEDLNRVRQYLDGTGND